jgi:hypothetical protein
VRSYSLFINRGRNYYQPWLAADNAKLDRT